MKFLLVMMLLFMQGEEVEPTNMEYIALFFNAIIAGVGVQLIKWKLVPWLKTTAPYLLPVISMAIGIVTAGAMSAYGIDLAPLGDIFGVGIMSGLLASSGFSVIKEIDNRRKK